MFFRVILIYKFKIMKANDRRIVTGDSETPHSFYISHYGAITQNVDFYLGKGKGFHVKNTSNAAITVNGKTASMNALVSTTIAPYSWSEELFDFIEANASVALQYGY